MSFEKYFKASLLGKLQNLCKMVVYVDRILVEKQKKKSLEKTGVVRSVILKKSCPRALAGAVRSGGGELFKNVAGSLTC